jgi:hypothetical protein
MGRDHFPNLPVGAGMGFSKDVLLLDDCEGTFNYIISGTGGDDVHAYATAAAFTGTYGMHLRTRTTAAAQFDIVTAQKLMSYPESGLLVGRWRVATPAVAPCGQITLELMIDNGAQIYYGAILLMPATGVVNYVNAAGAGVAIPAAAFTFVAGTYYLVELQINCRTRRYISALINGTRVNLSALDLYNPAASAGRGSMLLVQVVAAGAAPAAVYLDNLYVGESLES